jgi:3-oxoacyl-(acyl-carrier-protein) synthase
MSSPNDVVVTGISAINSHGNSVDEIWQSLSSETKAARRAEFSLSAFKAAPYLTDKRMMKAVSHRDSIGLAAVEELKRSIKLADANIDAYRKGFFVGACPSTVDDNDNYVDAVKASQQTDGRYSEFEYGRRCMDARPTTLLLGLPNNVLCYGAIITEAKGPNNNYTSGDTSAHCALRAAMRSFETGRIDFSVVGGYSVQTNPFIVGILAQSGELRRSASDENATMYSDGAVMMSLERRGAAEARGLKTNACIQAVVFASTPCGPVPAHQKPSATIIQKMMKSALERAGISLKDVGMIFHSGNGLKRVDAAEFEAIKGLCGEESSSIAVASLGHCMGNMLEASGLLELAIAQKIQAAAGEVPASIRTDGIGAANVQSDRRSVMIIKTSPAGEHSCVVAKVGA